MTRQNKSSLRYMLTVWFVTTLLAFVSNCSPRNGENGRDGSPGEGCTVTQLENGAEIICGGNTSAVILNGPVGPKGDKGETGEDGQDLSAGPYSVIEVIDPCGKQATFDEVLLKLNNGKILAHYSDGAKQFLGLIGPGSYVTTDGTNCHFTVGSDMKVSF